MNRIITNNQRRDQIPDSSSKSIRKHPNCDCEEPLFRMEPRISNILKFLNKIKDILVQMLLFIITIWSRHDDITRKRDQTLSE